MGQNKNLHRDGLWWLWTATQCCVIMIFKVGRDGDRDCDFKPWSCILAWWFLRKPLSCFNTFLANPNSRVLNHPDGINKMSKLWSKLTIKQFLFLSTKTIRQRGHASIFLNNKPHKHTPLPTTTPTHKPTTPALLLE